MKTNIQKIILIIIISIFVLSVFGTISFAGEKLDPSDYETTLNYNDAKDVFNRGAKIIKVLRNSAAIVSVIALTIIGFRYMMGSVEQKAEYKQTMMPVAIGCILVASLSAILTAIQSVF